VDNSGLLLRTDRGGRHHITIEQIGIAQAGWNKSIFKRLDSQARWLPRFSLVFSDGSKNFETNQMTFPSILLIGRSRPVFSTVSPRG